MTAVYSHDTALIYAVLQPLDDGSAKMLQSDSNSLTEHLTLFIIGQRSFEPVHSKVKHELP